MVGRYPDHRVRTATNIQHWQWLTFLHWPMAPATVQRLLPPTLSVDTFEGRAWLTITPFRMRLFAPGAAAHSLSNRPDHGSNLSVPQAETSLIDNGSASAADFS